MPQLLLLFFPLVLVTSGSSSVDRVGILVMAHGGSPEWNEAVEEAAAPLRSLCPITVAFGMAQRGTLKAAIQELETEGVSRIAVVGLFVSPRSFRHQAEYLLGVREDPPRHFVGSMAHAPRQGSSTGSDGAHGNTIPLPIRTEVDLILNRGGLYDSPRMGEILLERVRAQSVSPPRESVLILAHGAGEDAENDRWLARLDQLANQVRDWNSFRAVRVETLREDWEEKRKAAEERIRYFVTQGDRDEGRVIVVPFRLFGFGPYRDVLKGLSYAADEMALLPHAGVAEWIREEAADCFSRAGWPHPFSLGPGAGRAREASPERSP